MEVQLIPCNSPVSTLPHWNWFVVPAGDVTSISSITMFLQTLGLEQTTYPEYGDRALLVEPEKFEILTLLIVRLEGDWLQSVRFFWP